MIYQILLLSILHLIRPAVSTITFETTPASEFINSLEKPAPKTLEAPRPTRCCVQGNKKEYDWISNNAAPGELSVVNLEKNKEYPNAWIIDLKLRLIDSSNIYAEIISKLKESKQMAEQRAQDDDDQETDTEATSTDADNNSAPVLAPIEAVEILVDRQQFVVCDERNSTDRVIPCARDSDWFNSLFHLNNVPGVPVIRNPNNKKRQGNGKTRQDEDEDPMYVTPYMAIRYVWREVEGRKYDDTVYSVSCFDAPDSVKLDARSPGYCWRQKDKKFDEMDEEVADSRVDKLRPSSKEKTRNTKSKTEKNKKEEDRDENPTRPSMGYMTMCVLLCLGLMASSMVKLK